MPAVILTDSCRIAEETTSLGMSWLAVRENAERLLTPTIRMNMGAGSGAARLTSELSRVLRQKRKKAGVPHLWDRDAAV
jgi:UDP-N-acetylglucosamine 2-epimerase